MHNLFKQSWTIVILASAIACGGDDPGTSESPEATAGTNAGTSTAGKTAGTTSSARAGTGATAAAGSSASTPRAGNSATVQPTAAGKGAAGAGTDEDDAGVPSTGPVSTAGRGGSPAQAGSGGSAGRNAPTSAAGSGGSSAAAGSGSSATATFTQVYSLFSSGCAGGSCHVNATLAGGRLSMADKATAYMNLVNVDATQCAGEKRVVPGDASKSELVASLKHTQIGSCARTPRMPEGKAQLKDSDITLVSSWIEAGAQNN